MTDICIGNLITIGYDNGMSPGWRQAIIWTNAGIFLIGSIWTNFSESAKWWPFCLSLTILNQSLNTTITFVVGGPIIHKEQQEEQCT